MIANSPLVIFSSCPMLPSDLGVMISISIPFFAYPYQYVVVSGIGIDLSKDHVLRGSSQSFARLRRIAAASIREIVLAAQNGELVYFLVSSHMAVPVVSGIYHWAMSYSLA